MTTASMDIDDDDDGRYAATSDATVHEKQLRTEKVAILGSIERFECRFIHCQLLMVLL
jgi:hypothetical protein